MKAVGFLCGAGSMLFEARELGADVIGNVDSRPYYKKAPWVWPTNFPDAPFYHSIEDLEGTRQKYHWDDADVALGHPPCGKFSRLGNSGAREERFKTPEEREAWHAERRKNRGLLPDFIELVNRFQPKTFALDNLPKMLGAIPESEWKELLPGYRMTFIVMSNWDYGSPQVRKRLWVIGSRGKRFRFVPISRRPKGAPKSAWEAVRDLPWEPWVDLPDLDHVHHKPGTKPIGGFWTRDHEGERFALQDMARYAYGYLRLPPGFPWVYLNVHGRYTNKIARTRLRLGTPCRTLNGGEGLNHPLTGWPFTIRERARLMGWPDDFRLNDGSEMTRSRISSLIAVTGRAVPNEFPRYLLPQLFDHASRIR